MRNDLNTQLCERERYGSSQNYHPVRRLKAADAHVHDDDGETFTGISSGHREGMKFRHVVRGDTKSLSENFKPLWGFIHKSVGRKWNDIYSEICSVFDKRSVINQHILLHLEQRVETRVREEDGVLYTVPTYGRGYPVDDWSVRYYVDPRDGILKLNKYYKTYTQHRREMDAVAATERLKTHRRIDDYTDLRLLDGVWFEIKYTYLTPTTRVVTSTSPYQKNRSYTFTQQVYGLAYDVVEKATVSRAKYASSKRTLSKKELKHYGLRNTV